MNTNTLKTLPLNVPHAWLNPLLKQAFRFQLKIDDFVALGLVEFLHCLPGSFLDYMDTEIPDPLNKADHEVFEVLMLTLHKDWTEELEKEAKRLGFTPLTLLYVSLRWLADQPEDDEHLLKAKNSQSWLAPIQG